MDTLPPFDHLDLTDVERGLLWEINHAARCNDLGQPFIVGRSLARMAEMLEDAARERALAALPVIDREP